MLIPGIVFVLTGLLFIALGIPLILRRVPPNSLYGLRTRNTLDDEWVWYEANAASGRDLAWLGLGLVLIAILAPLAGIGNTAYALIWTLAATLGVLILCVAGWRRANRLLRER